MRVALMSLAVMVESRNVDGVETSFVKESFGQNYQLYRSTISAIIPCFGLPGYDIIFMDPQKLWDVCPSHPLFSSDLYEIQQAPTFSLEIGLTPRHESASPTQ